MGQRTGDCDNVLDQDVELTTSGVKLLQRLASRGSWAVPAAVLDKIPERLWAHLEKLDPDTDERRFDRCVRLFIRMQDQNLARDKAEIRFYGPQAVSGPDTPESTEAPSRPLLAHQERPTLKDASATLKVLDDLGILGDIASGNAQRGDVLDGKVVAPTTKSTPTGE